MYVAANRDILSETGSGGKSVGTTRGASRGTLATSRKSKARASDDHRLFIEIQEKLLSWRHDRDQLDEEFSPSVEIIDTAIDYICDLQHVNGSAPTFVVSSGRGEITFEWHGGEYVTLVRFIGRGEAEVTHLRNGRVEERESLCRDPQSRRLELDR